LKFILTLLVSVGCLTFLVWLVARAPSMAEARRASAERVLQLLFEVDVAVRGPVEIELWPSMGIQIVDLSIALADQPHLEVARTAVKLAPWRLLSGGSVLQEVHLTTGYFDRSSGTSAGDRSIGKAPRPIAPATLSSAFASVLNLEHLSVSDFRFVLGNADDGWAFNLTIQRASLARASTGNVQNIEIAGDLNGGSFHSSATVDRMRRASPEARPFVAQVAFAARSLTGAFDIHSPTADFDQDLEVDVRATAGSLTDALAFLGISGAVEGKATLLARLTGSPASLAARQLDLGLAFAAGEQVRLSGSVGDLWAGEGLDLTIDGNFSPGSSAAAHPPSLREIQVTGFSGKLENSLSMMMMRDFVLRTNALDGELREIGPISVDALRKDVLGRVGLHGVRVVLGSAAAPALLLSGSVDDVLRFEGVKLSGNLNVEMGSVLGITDPGKAKAIGRLVGRASVSDGDGSLGVDALEAHIEGSDVVSLRLSLALADPSRRSGIGFDVALSAPYFGELARLLEIETRFTGELRFEGQVFGERRSCTN
jgi:hypothetical protein